MRMCLIRFVVRCSLTVIAGSLIGSSVAEAIRIPMERVCRALDDARRFAGGGWR